MAALYIFSFFCLFASGCSSQKEKTESYDMAIRVTNSDTSLSLINPNGQTILERINPPAEFKRIAQPDSSFGSFLRHLPLKEHGSPVLLFNGLEKSRQDVHIAIVDMDVGNRDLQQCADAVMRLRAEYLYQADRYDQIRFHFTNGFLAEYKKWREGYRIKVSGNNVVWLKRDDESVSYDSFRRYLETVFAYAGTLSLEKETQTVLIKEAQSGDFFITGGSPGHAIIIIDICENMNTGEKKMLLAQSYMPAQEIHVLKNPQNPDNNPWYNLDFGNVLRTPEWTFEKTDLHRF